MASSARRGSRSRAPPSRPARRSASRTPSPAAGRSPSGARAGSVSTSKAAATAGQLLARSSGRSASAIRRRTRRHSSDRTARRRDDQLVERAGQRRARQLAPGGEQLLGDERAGRRSARRRGAAGWPTRARPRCPRSAPPARRDRAAGGPAARAARGAATIARQVGHPRVVAWRRRPAGPSRRWRAAGRARSGRGT